VTDRFFPYEFDRRWSVMFRVLGVDAEDGVRVGDDGSLVATYGRVRIDTTLDNVDHTEITGPHRWYTAVGLRLSAADSGITFGTNHRSGLCIAFVEAVPKVLGFKDHAALWVSVADPHGLAAALG
jgi:hypothetical protein